MLRIQVLLIWIFLCWVYYQWVIVLLLVVQFCLLLMGLFLPAMFFSVGMIYDRYHQRDLLYYRGLAGIAPVFSLLYFLRNLANLGVPLSFNFLGEFLIFAEIINIYHFAAPLLIIALIIQVGYTMKLLSILFGETIVFLMLQS